MMAETTKRKSPGLAFFLSFVLPGAGLWYLGRWAYGFLNLGVVLALGFALAMLLDDQVLEKYSRYIAIGCAAGSGSLAQALARQTNEKAAEPIGDGNPPSL